MSGQRQQSFAVGPGYRASLANPPTPQVRSQNVQREAPVIRGNGTALAQVGQALSGFFNLGAGFSQLANELEHRDDLYKARIENEEISRKGAADAMTGSEMDPQYANRLSYYQSYVRTRARSDADKDAETFAENLSSQPFDGQFDPDAYFDEFMKSNFGKGTGDPEYDAEYLAAFNRATDPLRTQFKSKVIETAQANHIDTLRSDITRTLTTEQQFTAGAWKELMSRTVPLFKGNEGEAKKFMVSVLADGIKNPGQAESTLAAMREIGLDVEEPDLYLDLEGKAMRNIASIQSYTGLKAYNAIESAIRNDIVSGKATVDSLTGYMPQIADAFRRYGGLSQADSLYSMIQSQVVKLANKEADVNAILSAWTKGVPLEVEAAGRGKSTSELRNTYGDQAIAQFVAMSPELYPALTQSTKEGFVDPTETAQGAAEFGRLMTDPATLRAFGGEASGRYKSLLSTELTSLQDPARAANAFRAIDEIARRSSPEIAMRYLDGDAQTAYLTAKQATDGTGRVEEFFRTLKENPGRAELVRDAYADKTQWGKLLDKPGEKASELEAKIDDKFKSKLIEAVGRSGFFSDPNAVVANSNDMRLIRSEIAQALLTQRQGGLRPDVDRAVTTAWEKLRQQFVPLPGEGKSVVLVRDPFAGRGRAHDSPISTIGGQDVYAPFKMVNRKGEVEDPMETFREDVKAVGKTLPGLFGDPESVRVYTDPSTAGDGLFPLMVKGEPLIVGPGMEITVTKPRGFMPTLSTREINRLTSDKRYLTDPAYRDDVNARISRSGPPPTGKVRLPEDPVEFEKTVKGYLPPGFHLKDDGAVMGPNGLVRAYKVVYGFRLKYGKAQAEADLNARTQKYRPPTQ